jgi:hypothetical protein
MQFTPETWQRRDIDKPQKPDPIEHGQQSNVLAAKGSFYVGNHRVGAGVDGFATGDGWDTLDVYSVAA